jgi:flagellar hook-basal body protein
MTKLTANLAFLLNPTSGAGGIFDPSIVGDPTNPGIGSAKVDPNDVTQLDLTSGATPLPLLVNNADVTWADGNVGNVGPQVMGQIGTYSSTTGQGVTFNGDGTPASIIPNAMQVYWANGAEDQHGNTGTADVKPQISLSLGSLNESNGLTQLGGDYQVTYMTQNGAKFGNFSGVSIGTDGIVTALFDNGVRSPVFQIPISTFANPDGLQALTGNVWIATSSSGNYTVRAPGQAGSGTVQQSSLEASTVDLGTEFTNMITVQNAYSAAAKVITTTDQMLQTLTSIIQT